MLRDDGVVDAEDRLAITRDCHDLITAGYPAVVAGRLRADLTSNAVFEFQRSEAPIALVRALIGCEVVPLDAYFESDRLADLPPRHQDRVFCSDHVADLVVGVVAVPAVRNGVITATFDEPSGQRSVRYNVAAHDLLAYDADAWRTPFTSESDDLAGALLMLYRESPYRARVKSAGRTQR